MLDTALSLREYLNTAFGPDVDYVDDHIEERNVGEREHSELQTRVWALLKKMRVAPYVEARLKVSETRFRVPDICAYSSRPDESVFTHPPFLCVEILSPEDRMTRIMERVDDYLNMGVPDVWVLDPLQKRAYVANADGFALATDRLRTFGGHMELSLDDVFSDSDLF